MLNEKPILCRELRSMGIPGGVFFSIKTFPAISDVHVT